MTACKLSSQRLCNINIRKLFKVSPVIAGILAALVYGSWAAFVNSEHGTIIWVKAGLGQGTYAFFSTWIVTNTALKSLAFFGSRWWAQLLSFLTSFLVMITFPLTIHTLLGTVDILQAIAPGLIWGSVYINIVIRLQLQSTR